MMNYHEKFRFLFSGGVIIDSNKENESEEEPFPNGYLIIIKHINFTKI